MAVLHNRVEILEQRVDDYHDRLRPIEASHGEPRARERERVDRLAQRADAIDSSIHSLELRFTAFTSRVSTVGMLLALALPIATALLVRLIGR